MSDTFAFALTFSLPCYRPGTPCTNSPLRPQTLMDQIFPYQAQTHVVLS